MATPSAIEPAIDATAFNCPNCGALAKQFWWECFATHNNKDQVPFIVARDKSNVNFALFEDDQDRLRRMERWAERMATGLPHLQSEADNQYGCRKINNLAASSCFNCDEIAIWIYDRLVWPVQSNAPAPSIDLPASIRLDYEEAAKIADLSPRGAAAILRLCVQKLCIHLGEKGDNLNHDIASLVSKGLAPRVQQALDVVRVIGNNAVHPGQIDFKDDRAIAGNLFQLVNLIVEIMISQPKHVAELFDGLPQGAKAAIEQRDKKTGQS